MAITPDSERLIEQAGRTCYMSFEKQSPGSHERFIKMILKNGHTSVLEHASAAFRVRGVSRSCTHQLVRHRLCAYSQQSQRYVDETGFKYVVPDSIASNPGARDAFEGAMQSLQGLYSRLKALGVPNEDARYVLPNAAHTEIVMSANFRQWRHIIEVRCEKRAQWEIRELMILVLDILQKEAPSVFHDYVIDRASMTVVRK